MSETPVEQPTPNPAVAILRARQADLVGGVQSIGVQEQQVAQMQAALEEALATLAECKSELAWLDASIAILEPVSPEPPAEPSIAEQEV